jgi:hypothetical protein
MLPLDLHVLGLPPAFNLSHDQTLQLKVFDFKPEGFPSKSAQEKHYAK